MFGRRADATLARDLTTMRRFMPFVSPRRNESLVYFDSEIEVDAALRFLEERNRASPPERRMTLFHLYLRSLAIHFHARPNLNRFAKGGRIWQRRGVWLTFSAKQEIVEGARLLTVKREFPESESLEQMTDAVLDRLTRQRGGERATSDREMKLALRLPPLLIRALMGSMHAADRLGVLPRAMIESDPMFTSVFVANLGSLDMDAGYHHLWEHGTCSAFATLGRLRPGPAGGSVLPVRYSYDERIEDGLYAGATLAGVKAFIESPEKLV